MEKVESPVQPLNTGDGAGLPNGARWDDMRIAMTLAEAGSFRRTAELSGITINTVRARLDRLEAAVGVRLFRRSPKGVAATPAGQELVAEARRISSRVAAVGVTDQASLVSADELRIGVSEALGVLWMAPRMGELQSRIGPRSVNLICSYDLQRDRSIEVDVEVGFKRSENPDMVCARLASVHFIPFAARRYLERNGVPETLLDLTRHRVIELVSPGVNSHILHYLVGTGHERSFTPLRTNSGMALLAAVENGEGIGFMPTYVMALDRDLMPIDLPVQLRFDIFVTYASDLRGSTPVVETVRWLRQVFHPGWGPWFAEHFVHPRDIPQRLLDAVEHDAGAMLDNSIR